MHPSIQPSRAGSPTKFVIAPYREEQAGKFVFDMMIVKRSNELANPIDLEKPLVDKIVNIVEPKCKGEIDLDWLNAAYTKGTAGRQDFFICSAPKTMATVFTRVLSDAQVVQLGTSKGDYYKLVFRDHVAVESKTSGPTELWFHLIIPADSEASTLELHDATAAQLRKTGLKMTELKRLTGQYKYHGEFEKPNTDTFLTKELTNIYKFDIGSSKFKIWFNPDWISGYTDGEDMPLLCDKCYGHLPCFKGCHKKLQNKSATRKTAEERLLEHEEAKRRRKEQQRQPPPPTLPVATRALALSAGSSSAPPPPSGF